MKNRSTICACTVALGLIAGSASLAEPQRVAQAGSGQALPPYEIVTIIRSRGLDPLGPPVRRGAIYVLHAIDVGGDDVRVIVDARNGRIQAIEPLASASRDWPPQRVVAPPYPPYGPPPRVRVLPPDVDDLDVMPPPGRDYYDWGRPPPARTPQMRPPAARPEAAARSAAVTPIRPPLPRPRPATKAAAEQAPVPPPARAAPIAPPETRPSAQPDAKPAVQPESKPAAKPAAPPVVGFD